MPLRMPGTRIPISLLMRIPMLCATTATMSALHLSHYILTMETIMHTNKAATGTQRGSGPGNAGGHNNSDTTIAIVITSVVPTARRTAVATTATNAIPSQWQCSSNGVTIAMAHCKKQQRYHKLCADTCLLCTWISQSAHKLCADTCCMDQLICEQAVRGCSISSSQQIQRSESKQ